MMKPRHIKNNECDEGDGKKSYKTGQIIEINFHLGPISQL